MGFYTRNPTCFKRCAIARRHKIESKEGLELLRHPLREADEK